MNTIQRFYAQQLAGSSNPRQELEEYLNRPEVREAAQSLIDSTSLREKASLDMEVQMAERALCKVGAEEKVREALPYIMGAVAGAVAGWLTPATTNQVVTDFLTSQKLGEHDQEVQEIVREANQAAQEKDYQEVLAGLHSKAAEWFLSTVPGGAPPSETTEVARFAVGYGLGKAIAKDRMPDLSKKLPMFA